MESGKNDIRHFDILENTLAPDDNALASIKKMDDTLSGIAAQATSNYFTSRVVRSALLLAKRKANLRILYWLTGIFFAVGVVSFFVFPAGSSVVLPEYIAAIFEQMGNYMAIFADPKLKQFFLITEGIICLVIIEKIVSSYKFFGRTAH